MKKTANNKHDIVNGRVNAFVSNYVDVVCECVCECVYESVNLSEREIWDQPSTERSAI